MAGLAAFHAGGSVLIDERSGFIHMAVEAGLFVGERLLHQGEGMGNCRLTAARRDVRLAGTVAAFAARAFRRFFTGRDALVVRILIEVEPDVGMTRTTGVTSDVSIAGCGRRGSSDLRRR